MFLIPESGLYSPFIINTAGLALGLLLGYSLQRGGFCMNTAFRSLYFGGDRSLVRAWVLVLAINIPGVYLLRATGMVTPLITPFFWQALLAGGFIFGAGMVLAGGCASGTWYRSGRGMLGSIGALAGFMVGTVMADGGMLDGIRRGLRASVVDLQGREITLFDLPVIGQPAVRTFLLLAASGWVIWFLVRSPKQKYIIGWGWKRTGFMVGILALATWVLSAMGGRDFGLSFTQPTVALTRYILAGDTAGIGIASFIVLGVPAGSFLSAWAYGDAMWSFPGHRRFFQQTAGGLVMGIGASIAGGCNIGHGITGVSTLGIGAITGVVAIMAGCWTMTAVAIARETAKKRGMSASGSDGSK